MDHGRLIALDTPAGHLAVLGDQHRVRFALSSRTDPDHLAVLDGVAEVAVQVNRTRSPPARLNAAVQRQAGPAMRRLLRQTGDRALACR